MKAELFLISCGIFFCSILYAQDDKSVQLALKDSLYQEAFSENKLDKAQLYLQEAIEIGESLAPQDTSQALRFNNMAQLLFYQREFEEAINLIQKALAIREQINGKDHPEYLNLLNNLSGIYHHLGMNEKSEKSYLKLLRLHAIALGKDNIEYALTLNNLAYLYQKTGDYRKAAPLFVEALKITEQLKGVNSGDYAKAFFAVAGLYQRMGQLDIAEKMYFKALPMVKNTLGEESKHYSYILNNLAYLYQKQGKYEEAEVLYKQAIALAKKVLGEKHKEYVLNMGNLASLYELMNRFEESETLYHKVLELNQEILGADHEDYAIDLNNLAILYRKMKRYADAIKYYQQSLQILKKRLGADHPRYANGLGNLALVYEDQQRLEEAEKLFLEALAIQEDALGKQHFSYINTLNDLGTLKLKQKQFDLARKYFVSALRANSQDSTLQLQAAAELSQLISKDYVLTNKAISSLDGLYRWAMKQGEDYHGYAFEALRASLGVQEKLRSSFHDEQDKLRALKTTADLSGKAIQLSLLSENPQHRELAFQFAEQNKSVLLAEAYSAEKARKAGVIPPRIAKEEERLLNQEKSLEKQLLQKNTATKQADLERERSNLKLEIQQFKKQLKSEYPRYYQLNYSNSISDLTAIQQVLQPTDLLMEYVIHKEQSYLFAIGKDSYEIIKLNIEYESLQQHINNFRAVLTDYEALREKPDQNMETYILEASWFYQQLVAPVLQKNPKVNHLIIVPDGDLANLPFGTFLSSTPKEALSFKQLPYLLRSHRISYNYSATLWTTILKQPISNTSNNMLAGAAFYSGKLDSLNIQNRSPQLRNLRDALSPLPNAIEEVNALEESFNGLFLSDTAFNERNFKEIANDYAVIHLAMHGLLNRYNPILSSLVFTENGDTTEDNFLEAWEIAQMNLNAQLVVLSACETGYGKFQQGNGTASLARAFMYAGVPSLVVSLWQVNDQSTSLIMQKFYANLAKGMDKAEALQQAKLSYIEKVENPLAAHPAFWAPFIQIGNASAIELQTQSTYSWLWWTLGAVMGMIIIVGIFILKRKS